MVILDITAIVLIVVIGIPGLVMLHRRSTEFIDLSILIEAEQRRMRHAIKNLAAALRMESVVAKLEEPPEPIRLEDRRAQRGG